MKCEKCGNDHDGSYGSGRFCSDRCRRQYSASKRVNPGNSNIRELTKSDKSGICIICHKSYSNSRYRMYCSDRCKCNNRLSSSSGRKCSFLSINSSISEVTDYQNLSKKEIYKKSIYSPNDTLKLLIRSHPLVSVVYDSYDERVKRSIITRYIRRYTLENSIELFNLYPKYKFLGRTYHKRLFEILVQNKSYNEELLNYLETHTCRELGSYLSICYRTISGYVKFIGHEDMLVMRRSSKAHLLKKPIIESVIGSTETEYYICTKDGHKFYVDEFSKYHNLAIEIDGEWCHDPEKDRKRDLLLSEEGISTIRFKSTDTDELIVSVLSKYVNDQ